MSLRSWRGPVLGVVFLAMGAVPGVGQINASPWIGLYAPTKDLGEVQAIKLGEKSSTLAYGLDMDFMSRNVIGFRIGAGYGTNSEVDFDEQACTACALQATILTITGAVVLRPIPFSVISPYVVAGGGWKYYNFDFEGTLSAQLSDQGRGTWVAGVGAQLMPQSSLSLFVEVADFFSGALDFDDDTSGNGQQDLVLKAGVSIRFGGGA